MISKSVNHTLQFNSPKVSGTKNGGTCTVPYKAILGGGVFLTYPSYISRIHTAHIGEVNNPTLQ